MVTRLPWQPWRFVNNLFVLSGTEFIFGAKIRQSNLALLHSVISLTQAKFDVSKQ